MSGGRSDGPECHQGSLWYPDTDNNRWEYVTTTIARQPNISDCRLTNAGINTQNTGYTVEFDEKCFPNLRLNSESDGFDFIGDITAVLDSRGHAKWVVIKSNTIVPVSSGGVGISSVTPVTFNGLTNTFTFSGSGSCALELLGEGGLWPSLGAFSTNVTTIVVIPTVNSRTNRVTCGNRSWIFGDGGVGARSALDGWDRPACDLKKYSISRTPSV